MKKSNLLIGTFSFVLITLMFLSSCSTISITSRRYNKGFHIEWASKSSKGSKVNTETQTKKRTSSNMVISNDVINEIELEDQNVPTERIINNYSQKESSKLPKNKVIEKGTSINNLPSINEIETFNVSKKTKLVSKKSLKRKASKSSSSDLSLLILVIIALFIPPLAVYLFEGSWTSRVTLNVILCLLAIIIGGVIIGTVGFSLWIIPIIHALLVILT